MYVIVFNKVQERDFICDYGKCMGIAVQFYWYKQDKWLIVRCQKHAYLSQHANEITYDEAVVYDVMKS